MEVKTALRLEDDRLPLTTRLIREASNVLGHRTSPPAQILLHAHFLHPRWDEADVSTEKALESSHFLCKVFLIPPAKPGISSMFPQAPGLSILLGCTFLSWFL